MFSNHFPKGIEKHVFEMSWYPREGEEDLKQIVAGKTNQEATALFQEPPLNLQLYDASALAGVVFSAKGKYFSSLSSS
jgi:hypothetical protein